MALAGCYLLDVLLHDVLDLLDLAPGLVEGGRRGGGRRRVGHVGEDDLGLF